MAALVEHLFVGLVNGCICQQMRLKPSSLLKINAMGTIMLAAGVRSPVALLINYIVAAFDEAVERRRVFQDLSASESIASIG